MDRLFIPDRAYLVFDFHQIVNGLKEVELDGSSCVFSGIVSSSRTNATGFSTLFTSGSPTQVTFKYRKRRTMVPVGTCSDIMPKPFSGHNGDTWCALDMQNW